MLKRLFLSALITSPALISAQKAAPEGEKELIKEMCGCYEVEFKYTETFSEQSDYQLKEPYQTKGLEWIFVEEEHPDEIILQHLLVINDSTVIKHWRQDWEYQNRHLLEYQKGFSWTKKTLAAEDAAGSWSQKVYQVDDSPRYEGSSKWIAFGPQPYWESEVAAPLPRREHTKRSDYNVMVRRNRHQITPFGHVHELDNAKVIRGEEDQVLVMEKGYNTYRKVDDERCALAQEWWPAQQPYWAQVRQVWDAEIAKREAITINMEVEGKKLWQRLYGLAAEHQGEQFDAKSARPAIEKAIRLHLKDTRTAVN